MATTEAVRGEAHEEYKLATDPAKQDALAWMNSIKKAFQKTRFWMIAWAMLVPVVFTFGQWTLVAGLVHMDPLPF